MDTIESVLDMLLRVTGLAAVSLLCVIHGADCLFRFSVRRREKKEGPAAKKAILSYRQDLMNDSWWFSEDPPTTYLLQDIAAGQYTVSNLRERWRQRRKDQRRKDWDCGPVESADEKAVESQE